MGSAASKATRSLPKTTTGSTTAAASASRPVQSAKWQGQTTSSGPSNAERESSGGREEKDDVIRRDAFDPDFVSQLNSLGPVAVDHHRPVSGSPSSSSSSHNLTNGNSSTQQSTASGFRSKAESPMLRILRARQEREESMIHALDQQEEQRRSTIDRSTTATTTNSNSITSAAGAVAVSSSPSDLTRTLDAPTLSMLLDDLKSTQSPSDVARLSHSYDFDAATLAILTRRFNSPSIGAKVDADLDTPTWNEETDSDRPPRIYAVWRQTSVDVGAADSSR